MRIGRAGRGQPAQLRLVSRRREPPARHEAQGRLIATCKRVVETTTRDPRFRDDRGRPNFNVIFYCLTKDGKYAAATSTARPAWPSTTATRPRMVIDSAEPARLSPGTPLSVLDSTPPFRSPEESILHEESDEPTSFHGLDGRREPGHAGDRRRADEAGRAAGGRWRLQRQRLRAVERAIELVKAGHDPLDAAIEGVAIVEADPKDHSVGLGGLPNEDGVVELDAAVMHGPTHGGGSVASLRNIVHPAAVARLVMQRIPPLPARRRGRAAVRPAHGFPEVNLLTDEARQIWLHWKETRDAKDDWLPPPDEKVAAFIREALTTRVTGTIHCSVLDTHGDLGCTTTTSGLSWKIPGRVGDSPILGAGLFLDNEVGSAGSTGVGELNLLNLRSAT